MDWNPELLPPDAARLSSPTPKEEETVKALNRHLSNMHDAARGFSAAAELLRFCREQEARPFRLWFDWSFLAGRAGVLSARNYGQAFRAVHSMTLSINAWEPLVSKTDFAPYRKRFEDDLFPAVDKLRHSVAHPEVYGKTTEDHSIGSVLIVDVLYDTTYISMFEGVLRKCDVSVGKARELVQLTTELFAIFERIARSETKK
jgi:hypothetical protein